MGQTTQREFDDNVDAYSFRADEQTTPRISFGDEG
jgi:hypothetical protein